MQISGEKRAIWPGEAIVDLSGGKSCHCTACDLENFWSHRVQGDARGSMAAMIQLV